MNFASRDKILIVLFVACGCCAHGSLFAQAKETEKIQQATRKIAKGLNNNNTDTLAQGYFDLGESYYRKGDLIKSEMFYQRSKTAFGKIRDAEGISKSSRALAQVQEERNKNKEAIRNYTDAQDNNVKTGDASSNILNGNDVKRLSQPDSLQVQEKVLQQNIDLGIKNKDTNEIISNYGRMGNLQWKNNATASAVGSFQTAYNFSKNQPQQALRFNQLITNTYLKDKDYGKAIETKKELLKEGFVLNSTQTQATEITSLADIYIQKQDDSTAIRLLRESYDISVKNGHTMEAKRNIEKLDSIFQNHGDKDKSLLLYKKFLESLPGIIGKDSSFIDSKVIDETEEKLKILETEKGIKDELISKKNLLNYWLLAFVAILAVLLTVILYILKKLKTKNKKIALQSLRREMNPHFIFNSLNSINQFIANNNELEANQYLTKFSTLMRNVMENSKEDFVLFSKEMGLLQNYLELEKSRFPDKFSYKIHIDDAIYAEDQLYIPVMLIQPHLENAIWHGLRYIDEKGSLLLSFVRKENEIVITIDDNGIGIAGSKMNKTSNQQKHHGRGITNNLERIKILNELYRHHITCVVEDKPAPDHGVVVQLSVPLLKNIQHED